MNQTERFFVCSDLEGGGGTETWNLKLTLKLEKKKKKIFLYIIPQSKLKISIFFIREKKKKECTVARTRLANFSYRAANRHCLKWESHAYLAQTVQPPCHVSFWIVPKIQYATHPSAEREAFWIDAPTPRLDLVHLF